MEGFTLSPEQKIVYAVGGLVLCFQEIERHFKFLVPLFDGDRQTWSSVLAKHQNLSREPLGRVVGLFLAATTGDRDELQGFLKRLVDQRNEVVHHFSEKFGHQIAEGDYRAVADELKTLHERATDLLKTLRELAILAVESMRDTVFLRTESYDEIAALCEGARKNLQS